MFVVCPSYGLCMLFIAIVDEEKIRKYLSTYPSIMYQSVKKYSRDSNSRLLYLYNGAILASPSYCIMVGTKAGLCQYHFTSAFISIYSALFFATCINCFLIFQYTQEKRVDS